MKGLMLKAVMATAIISVVLPLAAHAQSASNILHKACTHGLSIAGCAAGDQGIDSKGASGTTYLQDLVNTFLYAAGLVAVIFIIIGGIRYITSTGDSARIKSAKDTILYAVIGLIVAILALPISGYVITTVGG